MMQRDLSPIPFPNTLRDSNDIQTTTNTREFILPSAPPSEQMDYNHEPRHSIIRPVEPDHLPSPRIDTSNQHPITNKPLLKSIVRQSGSDDEASFQDHHEPIHNPTFINDNNSVLGATGYDPTQVAEVESDAAFALRLQQEEYTRESLMPNRHDYRRFQVESDDEPNAATPPIHFGTDIPQFLNDEQFAAYLQEQENRNRPQYQRPPLNFFQVRQKTNPAPSQTSETDEIETERVLPFRGFPQRPLPVNNDDDSDEENPAMNIAHPFFQFLANQGRPLPEDFHSLFSGYRGRGYRRSGNLQDTEEDFGPEDYERLLQLDDTIHKKKITKDQINAIPLEKYRRRPDTNDEENKCGVCLELFEENQLLRRFPCRHVYHKDCGDRWLQESNACPICREPPIKVSSSNSRHHRGPFNPRRPPPSSSSRNPTNRNNPNNNNNNNNNSHQHRRGPAPQRQS